MLPVALVALPSQQELVQSLSRQVEVVGVLNPSRARLEEVPAPVFADLDSLWRAAPPAAVCVLAPYPRLAQDLQGCLARQIHVLSAGPIPCSARTFAELCQTADRFRVHLRWGGQHHFSPLYQRLREQRLKPGFGQPVYLRQVRGGGQGLLPAWWAACQSLSLAQDLVGSQAREVHIAASREGNRQHLALTVGLASRTILHLIVSPAFPFPGDVLLVGSGGLLSSDAWGNAPAVLGPAGALLHPPAFLWPEPAWLLGFLGQLEQEPDPRLEYADLENRLWRGLRQARRQGQPVRIDLGA